MTAHAPASDPVPGAALVTGGAGGVGRATARALARSGRDVALLGRHAQTLDVAARALAQETGRRVVGVVADVADRAAVEAAVAKARAALGPLLVVVNAAGVAESAPTLPPDDALFDRTMATNVRGPWVVTTACLPDMLAARHGRVVNVASTAALQGARYVAAYVASKHALLGLTRALALDLASKGITVNAVCPGFLDTAMTDRTLAKIVAATGRTREEALLDVLKSADQATLLSPDDVAEAIVRLVRGPDERTGEAVEL